METATPVGLGLRAFKGGAVVVGVAVESGEPRVVLSTFLATCIEGDRLSLEPYNVAAELKRDSQGRASAEAAAVVAALLVNRTGWITDVLEYSGSWPEHVPVAEALAVRDALRFACKECRIDVAELDEKSLPDLAANTLDMSSMPFDARLKALGATVGRPWRKEQKLACLSAWFAVSERNRHAR